MDYTRGFIFVATGRRFVEEAILSRESLRRQMPSLPGILWTDVADESLRSVFDEVRLIENPQHSFADKVPPLLESPFEKTLFLDTDTQVCEPLDDLFVMLDRFDVLAAHAPMRVTWPQPEIPDGFVEINSGVLAWRKNERTALMFQKWLMFYRAHVEVTGQRDDQPALRRALYESDVRLGILPAEYNFRTVLPGFAGRGPVRILHGRGLESVARRVNHFHGCRVVLPGDRDLSCSRLIVLSGWLRWPMALLQLAAAAGTILRERLTVAKRRFLG